MANTTSATQATHLVGAPVPVGPSGPGALPRFEARCPDCAFVARSSLLSIATRDAWEHWDYMRRRQAQAGR